MKFSKIAPYALPLFALVCLVATNAWASPVVYTVNETITSPVDGVTGNPSQTDSVVGTITTDGTIGVLQTSNIVSWNLDLKDDTNPQYSIDLTPSNSSVGSTSSNSKVLSATATGLYFNFSGSNDAFAFQANSPGPSSGYHYWCLNSNWYGCAPGNSIAPDNVYSSNIGSGDDLVVSGSTQGQTGLAPLNPGQGTSATPEPSSLLLMGSGLAGFAGMMRRRLGLRA